MVKINIYENNKDSRQVGSVAISGYPEECPLCRKDVQQFPILAVNTNRNGRIMVVMECGRQSCGHIYTAEYVNRSTHPVIPNFCYSQIIPIKPDSKTFDEIIERISPYFVKVFNESYACEQQGFTEICGPGYRKSLEYLIKDYLIKCQPEKSEEIGKRLLSPCIGMLENKNLIETAKRATWLGNDQTHYKQKWTEYNIQDLKKLIGITVTWIVHLEQTSAFISGMDEHKK